MIPFVDAVSDIAGAAVGLTLGILILAGLGMLIDKLKE